MRATLLLTVLLLAPVALAADTFPVVLLSAKMDTIFDPVEPEQFNPVASHHRFTFTVKNVADGPTHQLVAIDAWWHVNSFPDNLYLDRPDFAPGETRSYVVDVDDGFWLTPGPMWFCLRATELSWPGDRCWSALVGFTHPDGVYPETVPNWQLGGVPMGDTE